MISPKVPSDPVEPVSGSGFPSGGSGRSPASRGPALAVGLAGAMLAGWGGLLVAGEPAAGVSLAELSFDELMQTKASTVYAASKREESAREAPSAVTVVTSADVKQYGYRTLADLLRGVGGFYVAYDRIYSPIGVRGINRPGDFGGRVLITVDGHRLNEPVFDSASSGTEFPLDVDLIDRVEVVRGPGSVLYGNNAVFAVINVVTRNGRELPAGEVSGSAASYDTYTGRVSLGHRFASGVEFLVSGTYLDSAGHERLAYPEFGAVNGGVAEDLDGQHAAQLFAKLAYGDFSLEGLFGDRSKSIPTAPYPDTVFNRAPNEAVDERAFIELKWQHEFAGEWHASARVGFDHYQFDGLSPVGDPADPDGVVVNRDFARARWWEAEAQVSRTFFETHALTLGAEFRQELEVRQKNDDLEPPLLISDVDSSGHDVGLYLEDAWAVRTNLTLRAGVRYDWFSTFGEAVNPRAALIYTPWEPTTFKLLYGQAYRAPNAYEFDYLGPGYVNNPGLGPERITSYEAVWEQQFHRNLKWSTSVFYNDIQDLITQVEDPASGDFQFINADGVTVAGVETRLEAHWSSGLRGQVSYTFAEAVEEATDGWPANSPRHLAQFGVVAPVHRDRVFLGFELQGLSERRTVRGTPVDGCLVANVTLFSRELLKNLEVAASLYNLFDARYTDPAGPDFTQDAIEQDGRNFRVKFLYRF